MCHFHKGPPILRFLLYEISRKGKSRETEGGFVGVRGWGRGLRKGGSVGEESACNAGDTGDAGSIPGLGRSPGGENGNPVQYSCLENAMDRGAWGATVHGVAKSQTQPRRLNTRSPWGGFLSGLIRNVPDGVAVMTAQHGEDTTDSDCLL